MSGIFFALEEAHRRFTPMIVLSSSVSVVSGFFIASALSNALGISISGFSLEAQAVLGINMFWIPVLMGICAGISNILILFSYKILKKFSNKLVDFPFTLRIIFIFILTVLIGMLSYNFTGSGHDVVEKIFTGSIVWYMLIIIFAVRCVMTLFSSISGVTGGLFLPTILFGALSASLCAKCIIASGAINQEYYTAMIVIGIAAFLGSAFKTPITAVIFAIEVFGGLNNSMFIVLGVYTSYFILETAGFASINDIVIEHKSGN
ncbi:hypothetical protein SDC9_100077 [bioreactor metagenome]|uniref:H(+)/Cl(-) exchange transporter ClcA n=1 Tax=bioreactor metagenome TaxID=1076179 RepID=A0A645AJK7_9ZZZZ